MPTLQRAPESGEAAAAGARTAKGTGGQGVGGLLFNKGAEQREQALSEKYGIVVGPGNAGAKNHFSHSMLDRIDSVLGALPIEHLRDNASLKGIQPAEDPNTVASSYDKTTHYVDIVRPWGMPSWLYTELSRKSPLQVRIMDRTLLKNEFGVTSGDNDASLGIRPGDRKVLGGVSDTLLNGNVTKWTLRHEIGHSVAQQINWTAMQDRPYFGGWELTDDYTAMAHRILEKVGLQDHADTVSNTHRVTLLDVLRAPMAPGPMRTSPQWSIDAASSKFESEPADFRRRLDRAVRIIKLMNAKPWTLADGGGAELQFGGRVYQFGRGDILYTYLAQERTRYAVSNYQFSEPDEWFAEAYAAYYDPKLTPRSRLNPQLVRWFSNELPRLMGADTP